MEHELLREKVADQIIAIKHLYWWVVYFRNSKEELYGCYELQAGTKHEAFMNALVLLNNDHIGNPSKISDWDDLSEIFGPYLKMW